MSIILEVKELKKYYSLPGAWHPFFNLKPKMPLEKEESKTFARNKAVDGVSFVLKKGEVLGIVGESGCGKTTLARLILRLVSPTSGEIVFSPWIQKLRKDAAIVFQDPFLSMDPRMRVKDILREPLSAHRIAGPRQRINELLELAGLKPDILSRLPAQLSGGERQRVCIARSLAAWPKLLVLDEPISSLDMINQRQILELLLKLKNSLEMTYIFISHNIAVVKKIADRVIVMLEGKIVEEGVSGEVLRQPKSAYTKKLLEAAR